MMSRSGSSGTRRSSPGAPGGSFLSLRNSIRYLPAFSGGLGSLLIQHDWLLAVGDDLFRDQHLLDVGLGGDVVHHVEHDVLHDGPQPTRTGLALERFPRD